MSFALGSDSRTILKKNFLVVYEEFKSAVADYIKEDRYLGKTERMDAFLAASIHALLDYDERFQIFQDERI